MASERKKMRITTDLFVGSNKKKYDEEKKERRQCIIADLNRNYYSIHLKTVRKNKISTVGWQHWDL